MTKRRPHGHTERQLRQLILTRDKHTCQICGHPGADTLGHIIPYSKRPDLALNPTNLQAQHGTKRTLTKDGYECPGNLAQHDHLPTPTPTRQW